MKRLFLISASLMMGSAAFAQSSQSNCVTAPVSLNGSQITLTTSGEKTVSKNETLLYYTRRHARHHEQAYPIAGIDQKYPSRPVVVSNVKTVAAMPETYNVTLSTPQNNVSVCNDAPLNLAANINVEKVSSYTGNYPDKSENKTYKQVSKHHYKMAARKIRKVKKNEDKIARKTGLNVEAKSDMNS